MYNLYIWENKYNLSVFAVSIAYAGDTQTTMTVTADDISSGDVAVISISLPSDAQGKVTFSVDGKNYDANIINGHETVNIGGLNTEQYTVTVTYDGDEQYTPITKDIILTVNESSQASDINASGEPDSQNANSNTTFNVTSPNNTTNTTNNTNNTNHIKAP